MIINSQYNVNYYNIGNNGYIASKPQYNLYMNSNMSNFANGCTSLNLNLDTFNVNYALVTNMVSSFRRGYSLSGNPVVGDNVINMDWAYYYCSNLTGSPVVGNNVVNMDYAYADCVNLTGQPVASDNLSSFEGVYNNCSRLTGEPVMPHMNDNGTADVIRYTYANCSNLTGNAKIPYTRNMSHVYANCTNLTGIDFTSLRGRASCEFAFYNCYNITINFSSNNTRFMPINAAYMFYNCGNIYGEIEQGKNVSLSSATDMSYCFYNCRKLTGNGVIGYSCINARSAYHNCFNISSFTGCSSTLGWVNTGRYCVNAAEAFRSTKVVTVFPGMNNSNYMINLTNASRMFYNCRNLIQGTIFQNVVNISLMYEQCYNMNFLNTAFMSNKIINMAYAFHQTKINESFSGDNVINMFYAFSGTNLTLGECGNNVVDMSYCYGSAINLTRGNFYGKIGKNVRNAHATFSDMRATPGMSIYINCYSFNETNNSYNLFNGHQIFFGATGTFSCIINCVNNSPANNWFYNVGTLVDNTKLTWETIPNGYRNTAYNINVYYNLTL